VVTGVSADRLVVDHPDPRHMCEPAVVSDTPGEHQAEHVEVQREVAAPAEVVWGLVADVTRMGEWSPEAVAHSWLDGADGPEVGARFRGRNRNGWRRWSTVAEVVSCEPGRSFGFDVSSLGLPVARWSYRIEPGADAGSCTVTESWTEQRGLTIKVLGLLATGVGNRPEHNRATMQRTLDALAAAAASMPESDRSTDPGEAD
jgi:hypothetical protein